MIDSAFASTLARRVVRLRRLVAAAALLAVTPGLVHAHAVVYPKTSTTGAHERYVLRVPNEKNVPTNRVEIRFPAGLKVSSFSDVAGWQLEVQKDSAGAIIGAVWTGTLQPQRFIEFPFVAANPKTEARIVWPVFQTYADGERVEWTGEEGSKKPASATTIGAAAAAGAATAGGATGGRGSAFPIAVAALVISVLGLGLSLRPRPAATA